MRKSYMKFLEAIEKSKDSRGQPEVASSNLAGPILLFWWNMLETVIKLGTPVEVSYRTLNLIPYESLEKRTVTKTGEFHSEPGIGRREVLKVEVKAERLLVHTLFIDTYPSTVTRVEHYEPGNVKENPSSVIEDLPWLNSGDEQTAIANHSRLVQD